MASVKLTSTHTRRLLCQEPRPIASPAVPLFSWSVIFLRILQHARWKLRPRHPKRDHVKQNKSDRCNAFIHFHIGRPPLPSPSRLHKSTSVLSLFCLPPLCLYFFFLLGADRMFQTHLIRSPCGKKRGKGPSFLWMPPLGSTTFGVLSYRGGPAYSAAMHQKPRPSG